MTAPAANTRISTASVTPTGDGGQTVTWQIPLDVADAVMAVLSRDADEKAAAGLDAPARVADSLTSLREAVIAGYDRMVTETLGCLEVLPGEGMLLTDGVIIHARNDSASVLLPGARTPADAVTAALDVLTTFGISFDATDPMLTATVGRPRFLVLRPCANPRHAAHPILAPDGGATPDAILATRIDFDRN